MKPQHVLRTKPQLEELIREIIIRERETKRERETEPQLEEVIRESELHRYDGMRSTRRTELIAQGLYPKPVRLSTRRKAWLKSEIARWQAARVAERDGARKSTAPSGASPYSRGAFGR